MENELDGYRKSIDLIDEKIVSLFEERMKVAGNIGRYKSENSLPVLDQAREAEKLSSVISMASDTFKPYIYRLYSELFSLSRDFQTRALSCRLAEKEDLGEITQMFSGIVSHMRENGITIWNEYYPNEEFPEDIDAKRLYVLKKNSETVAAFALTVLPDCPSCSSVKWEEDGEDALYLCRFGVKPEYLGQGIACTAMEYAKALTKAKGRRFLRLYVVDSNTPAVRFYTKIGFRRASGVHKEIISDDKYLTEYGFEIRV